jgi:beta-lactamase class A
MRLFFKRRPEDEEKSSEEKPKRKNRKKEPPKPWGKAERSLILFLLAATTLTSAFLALSARNWKLPGFPALGLPSLNFQKTYLFENNNQPDENHVQITQELESLTHNLSGTYGVYVIRLKTNLSYGLNENKSMTAASLIKLPVILTLYLEAEKGTINLDSKYTLNEADKIPGAGSLYYQPAGTVITYAELAHLMANQSDNTAFGITRRILGDEKIKKTISHLGMNHTSLDKNKTTPYDIGLFFQKLYQGALVSDEAREEILESLTNTAFEDYLPAAIPDEIQVAHKYGAEVHVINDAGIVFTDSPFILVLMSEGIIESEVQSIFPQLTQLIDTFETQ